MATDDKTVKLNITDKDVVDLLVVRHGTRVALAYFIKKANDAAKRFNLSMSNDNPQAAMLSAQEMVANVSFAQKILGDDENTLLEDKKK